MPAVLDNFLDIIDEGLGVADFDVASFIFLNIKPIVLIILYLISFADHLD